MIEKTVILYWLILLWSGSIEQAVAEGPPYKCSSTVRSQCVLKDIRVTKDNYHFEPIADDPSAITQVIITNSFIPLFGEDICVTFPNLAHLEIQAAEMEDIKVNAFDKCGQLSSLIIVNQHIKTLNKDVFKSLKKLYSLSLNNIGLKSLHVDTFASLTQLYSLSLSGNRLYDFSPALVTSLKDVDQLWINANELSDIDENGLVEALPKLTELYLNDNDLNCHRIESILRVLKERGVKGLSAAVQRKRYYSPQVINKIQCLTEEQWSNVYYAKVGQEMMEDLKELKNLIQILKWH